MRKQNIFLTLAIAFCFVVVFTIWLLVRKELRPVTFPPIVSAELVVGPVHKLRVLTPDELKIVQKWIKDNHKGWGPLHKHPPSTGDAEIHFNKNVDLSAYADKPKDQRPYPFTIVLWVGVSQADWNNRVFYEMVENGETKVFLKDCDDATFDPLRKLVDQYDYEKTNFP